MATLVKGKVAYPPKFWYAATEKRTPMLKFQIAVENRPGAEVPVIIFGTVAESNQDLTAGESVICSGEMTENTWRDETKTELKITPWRGTLRRVGKTDNDRSTSGITVVPEWPDTDATDEQFCRDTDCWSERLPRIGACIFAPDTETDPWFSEEMLGGGAD